MPLFVLWLVIVSNVFAQELRQDGNWWATLQPVTKLHFALGVCNGMNVGGALSSNGDISRIEGYNKWITNISVGQIIEGVDTIYQDYKNKRILIEHHHCPVISS